MTPEQILGFIVSHSATLEWGKPDSLIMQGRAAKVGLEHPQNWRLLQQGDGALIALEPPTPSALGKQSKPAGVYSLSEVAADALIGMYDRNWHAIQVAIGIGDTVRPLLAQRLSRIAYRLHKGSPKPWPKRIRRRQCECGRTAAADYVPDLVELAIRHLEQPYQYRSNSMRARWFGLAESHWLAVGRPPFDQVAAHLWSWYYAGIGHIQHRIIEASQAHK